MKLCAWDLRGPEGNQALAELCMPRLECLFVTHRKLSEVGMTLEGLRVLATAPWLAQLRCLAVEGGWNIPPDLQPACQQQNLLELRGGPVDELTRRGASVALEIWE